jgi:hypothetical protein
VRATTSQNDDGIAGLQRVADNKEAPDGRQPERVQGAGYKKQDTREKEQAAGGTAKMTARR